MAGCGRKTYTWLFSYIANPVLVTMNSLVIFRVHASSTFFAAELRRYGWISIIHRIEIPNDIQRNLFCCMTLKTNVGYFRFAMQPALRLFLFLRCLSFL